MARQGLSGKKLARDANLYPKLVSDLLTKVDDPRIGTIVKLAKALAIPPSLLLNNFIPVKGFVGESGRVRFVDDPDPLMVPRPPSRKGDLVALRVVVDTLRPAHRLGDILFISRESDRIELDYIGDECVAQTLDGVAYLRVLANGSVEGRHTLRHWAGAEAENVLLAWASPVLFTMRGREADEPAAD